MAGTQASRPRHAGDSATGPVKSSHIIEEHIDVGVPRESAYDQWTRYEDLSQFTKSESADPKGEERVGFTSKIGPSTRQWETEVVEQVPGRRVAWRSIGGAKTQGVVSFHQLDDRLTRVMVEMEYHPSGVVETVGNFLRLQRRRVRKDLRLFKNFIELRGEPTGAGARQALHGDHDDHDELHERSDGAKGRRRSTNSATRKKGASAASTARKASGAARKATGRKAQGKKAS